MTGTPKKLASKPASRRAWGGYEAGALHFSHRRRARRWAVINRTLEAILKGATPMFSNRVKVVGASLVCRVDMTRCPVCAALMAMSAVSRSRISPTMMMSGS